MQTIRRVLIAVWAMVPIVMLFASPGHLWAQPLPLTARDSGLYAISPWANLGPGETEPGGTFERTSSVGLNFSVRSIWNNASSPNPDLGYVISEIEAGYLYSEPRTMIVRINFWDGQDRYEGSMLPREVYRDRVLQSIAQLEPVLDKVHGISLSEENVPLGGRTAVLQYLYEEVKQNYPQLPVYQWWSPNVAHPERYEGIWLKADGWIVDPYTLTEHYPPYANLWPPDPYKRLVQKYLITGMPLVSIVPTSGEPPFVELYSPGNTIFTNGKTLWDVVNHQIETNIAYNVPTAFYWTDANGGAYFPRDPNDPHMMQIEDFIRNHSQSAGELPVGFMGNAAVADVWHNGPQTVVPVQARKAADIIYEQRFYGSEFLEESEGLGFRDLVVNGENLRVRGFNGRDADATLMYHFKTGQSLQNPLIVMEAALDDALAGRVTVSASHDGQTWVSRTFVRYDHQQLIEFSTAGLGNFASIEDLWVRIRVQGGGGTIANPVAVLANLRVINNAPTSSKMLLNVNFERGYSTGPLHDQDGGITGGPWSASNNNGAFNVINVGSGNQAVSLSRSNANGIATIPLREGLDTSFDDILFAFDFRRPDNNDQGIVTLRNSLSGNNTGMGIFVDTGIAPTLKLVTASLYTQADPFYDTLFPILNNTWYRVEIEADGSTGMYDAYITLLGGAQQRVLLAANLPWEAPNQWVDEFVYLPLGLSESALHLDNLLVLGQPISIPVPEPSSLMLLITAVTFACRRRSRSGPFGTSICRSKPSLWKVGCVDALRAPRY